MPVTQRVCLVFFFLFSHLPFSRPKAPIFFSFPPARCRPPTGGHPATPAGRPCSLCPPRSASPASSSSSPSRAATASCEGPRRRRTRRARWDGAASAPLRRLGVSKTCPRHRLPRLRPRPRLTARGVGVFPRPLPRQPRLVRHGAAARPSTSLRQKASRHEDGSAVATASCREAFCPK